MQRSSFLRSRGNNTRFQGYRGGGRGFSRPGVSVGSSRYVNKPVENAIAPEYVVMHQFADLDIAPELKTNIAARGYLSPTPIQDQVIPQILAGRDVVGVANTGTGKTAAFLVPLIDKVLRNRAHKILIIAPTRELAIQIDDELRLFAASLHIRSALVIGGANMNNQIWKLKQNPHFLISTPGRLKDFANRALVSLREYTTIVLDEVDRMVDIGFIADIRFLISLLPKDRQSLFFSATVPSDAVSIIQSFLTDPVTISVKVNQTAQGIDQDVIRVKSKEEKLEKLRGLLQSTDYSKVLIFGRTKWNVEKLARHLATSGFSVGSIHGNKSQGQRLTVLSRFKQNQLRILVATDVASRGLDIDDVSHVINFDEPATYDDYVHRIGRTGRANKTGKALTFVM